MRNFDSRVLAAFDDEIVTDGGGLGPDQLIDAFPTPGRPAGKTPSAQVPIAADRPDTHQTAGCFFALECAVNPQHNDRYVVGAEVTGGSAQMALDLAFLMLGL